MPQSNKSFTKFIIGGIRVKALDKSASSCINLAFDIHFKMHCNCTRMTRTGLARPSCSVCFHETAVTFVLKANRPV